MRPTLLLTLLIALLRPALGAPPPSDPLYGSHQWYLALVHAPEAWAAAGGAPTVVAVLDTGILAGHPDLPPERLLPGYDFISDAASAGDGDGRDPDPHDESAADPFGTPHGLHLAGLIAATADNGIGIAGVCPRCLILPVRVLGGRGSRGLDSDVADAIRWAAGLPVAGVPPNLHPAQVINLSLAGSGRSAVLEQAVADAMEQGALVVAAAGNERKDAAGFSPSGLPGVITVGAATRARARAPYSNFGPRVDLLAPGGVLSSDRPDLITGIWSLGLREGRPDYQVLEGTSQAAAQVSGALGLLRGVLTLHQDAAAQLLRETADDRFRCDGAPEGGCGAGLLDAARLVQRGREQAACGCGPASLCQEGRCVLAERAHAQGCQACGPSSPTGAGPIWLPLVLLFFRKRRPVAGRPAAPDWTRPRTRRKACRCHESGSFGPCI